MDEGVSRASKGITQGRVALHHAAAVHLMLQSPP